MKSIKCACALALCTVAVEQADARWSLPTWQGTAVGARLAKLDKKTGISAAIACVCAAIGWAVWHCWPQKPAKKQPVRWSQLRPEDLTPELKAAVRAEVERRKTSKVAQWHERRAAENATGKKWVYNQCWDWPAETSLKKTSSKPNGAEKTLRVPTPTFCRVRFAPQIAKNSGGKFI